MDALQAFYARIDCRLPRHDLRVLLRLCEQAQALPADALFAVLFELQHRPRCGPGLRRGGSPPRSLRTAVRRHSRSSAAVGWPDVEAIEREADAIRATSQD